MTPSMSPRNKTKDTLVLLSGSPIAIAVFSYRLGKLFAETYTRSAIATVDSQRLKWKTRQHEKHNS